MDDTINTDIIEVLKTQHNEAKEGLSSVIDAEPTARGAAFEKLAGVLTAHESGEAAIVYPAIEGLDNAAPVIAARKAEEAEAAGKIADLKALDPTSDRFAAGLNELKAAVEAHAGKEEAEVFPFLASLASAKRSELGASMTQAVKAN